MRLISSVRSSAWACALATASLLLTACATGWAETSADPPSRVAYVSAVEGTARITAGDGTDWNAATLNWPVTTGTQLQLDPGTRVALDGGELSVRLQGPAALSTTALEDHTTQFALTEGTLSLRLRTLQPNERAEIDTPQLALVALQPGEYRVDVDAAAGSTRVTVRSGSLAAYGEAGQSLPVAAGQQVVFAGRDLRVLSRGAAPGRDRFDQWTAVRDGIDEGAISSRYVSPGIPGYQALDAYGEWSQDTTYGTVWYPSVTVANWAPYRYGRWVWVAPWGWTWVDDAPWGFAPFHYGRWAQIGPRWAWVPGPITQRPVYAPALVQFFGAGPNWSVSIGNTGPGAAWFPLAPGEAWRPHYRASGRYLERVNDWGHWRGPERPRGDGYYFQHRPGAISMAPPGPLGRGEPGGRRPHYGDGNGLPPGWMQGGQVVAPPPRGGQGPGAPMPRALPMPKPYADVAPAPAAQRPQNPAFVPLQRGGWDNPPQPRIDSPRPMSPPRPFPEWSERPPARSRGEALAPQPFQMRPMPEPPPHVQQPMRPPAAMPHMAPPARPADRAAPPRIEAPRRQPGLRDEDRP